MTMTNSNGTNPKNLRLVPELNWQVGAPNIAAVRAQLHRLQKLAAMLQQAEQRYVNHCRNANGELGNLSDIRRARITRMAHKRIRQAFNNLANEMQL